MPIFISLYHLIFHKKGSNCAIAWYNDGKMKNVFVKIFPRPLIFCAFDYEGKIIFILRHVGRKVNMHSLLCTSIIPHLYGTLASFQKIYTLFKRCYYFINSLYLQKCIAIDIHVAHGYGNGNLFCKVCIFKRVCVCECMCAQRYINRQH